jgi:hypothetical protein
METNYPHGSVPSIRSNADWGYVPPIDVTSTSSEYFAFYPQSNIKEDSVPIQFSIGSSTSHVYDLESSFVLHSYLKLKVLKSDGTKLGAGDIVAPTHGFFASLFTGVEISLNGYPVSSSGNHYGYRHHLFNLLTYGTGYKSSILTEELFFPDSSPNKQIYRLQKFRLQN